MDFIHYCATLCLFLTLRVNGIMNLGLSNMSNSAPIGGDRPEASETLKLADHDDTNNMHAKKMID